MAAPAILLFHSLLGLRPGVVAWADQLRALGHIVHTPDLYDGRWFDSSAEAAAGIKHIGFDGVLERAAAAAADLPHELVYAGFSNGGACAELLAAARPGAKGAILIHAPLPIKPLGWTDWPPSVPVAVHFNRRDPLRDPTTIEQFAAKVRAAGAPCEEYLYEGRGHLFADPDLPHYNQADAALMLDRVSAFVERAGTG
jgi:dienelactone hydrolase